jgi:hypothetical protein
MGIILIIIGVFTWILWSNDIQHGKQNPMYYRAIHKSAFALIPYIFSLILITIGIILLVSKCNS